MRDALGSPKRLGSTCSCARRTRRWRAGVDASRDQGRRQMVDWRPLRAASARPAVQKRAAASHDRAGPSAPLFAISSPRHDRTTTASSSRCATARAAPRSQWSCPQVSPTSVPAVLQRPRGQWRLWLCAAAAPTSYPGRGCCTVQSHHQPCAGSPQSQASAPALVETARGSGHMTCWASPSAQWPCAFEISVCAPSSSPSSPPGQVMTSHVP
ncbi:hypothetical protein T440DRAFT_77234 [Plenodomus tracheiphilus IPT5]|uniref:Uncharacterized protein n=1 Tax=Plenodomus tracheiphilus IPT5 TaxID=1408161 RepID=A0A6A7B9C6_9PLEO|nr:hypothetical protein T440DRAFT_77234 [Plenodomus tracheiphilus IPT5]